jgi:hypothetical protein
MGKQKMRLRFWRVKMNNNLFDELLEYAQKELEKNNK